MEPFICSLWSTFSGKHPGGILAFSLQWEYSSSEWKPSGSVFLRLPAKNIAPVEIFWKNHFWNSSAREAIAEHRLLDYFLANIVFVIVSLVSFYFLWPFLNQF